MSSKENFCLHWNDFETNLSASFRELRGDKDFFDVTLACEDSQIEAHKVILSACSPFFRNILRNNRHQHPLLYIRGVKFKELVAVLDFMYLGEVNIAHDELNCFLAVAEDLKIKGLTQSNDTLANKKDSLANSCRSDSQSDLATNRRRELGKRKDSDHAPVKRARLSGSFPSASNRPGKSPTDLPSSTSTLRHDPSVIIKPSPNDGDDDIQEVVPVKSEPGTIIDQAPGLIGHQGHSSTDGGENGNENQQLVSQDSARALNVGDPGSGGYDYDGYEGEDNYVLEEGEAYDPTMFGAAADGSKGGSPVSTIIKTEDNLDALSDRRWDLEMGARIGFDINLFLCLSCSGSKYSSKDKFNVITHIKQKHFPEFAGFVCEICAKILNSRDSFESHVHTQHNIIPVKESASMEEDSIVDYSKSD